MQLGSPGRYQIVVVTLLQLNVFWYLVTIFTLSLWPYTPVHHCKLIDDNNATWLLNESLPLADPPSHKSLYDQCHMFADQSNHSKGVQKCENGYVYDDNRDLFSVAMEWDLICSEKYQLRVFQTLFLTGAVIGGVFGGALADKFGRKPLALTTLYCSMALSIIAALATHPYVFAAAKFLQGIMAQACMAGSMSLKIEMLPTKYRAKAHAIGEVIAATLCVLHIVLVTYLSGNWRYVEYLNVLPMMVTLGNIWIVPESIRWLLKNKKEEQAMATIQRIAKYNGITIPTSFKYELQSVIHDIEGEAEKHKDSGLKDLFRHKTIAVFTVVFMTNWISGTFLGMGVVLSLTRFSGSIFTNYLIMALAVFLVKTVFFITAVKIGRRITITMAFFTAGLTMLFSTLNDAVLEWDPLITTISGTTARGCVSALMSISFLYVAEIYPTELRTFAQGCCSGAGRIGSMLVPAALLIGDYTWDWLPFVLFGICGLISGSITQILPETRNKPMPNNVDDTLQMKRSKIIKSKGDKENKEKLVNNPAEV